jgi:hypothetical protein
LGLVKERPNVPSPVAAGLAQEPRFPDRRAAGDPANDRVAALAIRAIDQHAMHASIAHLSEGDLDRAGQGGHAPLKRGQSG